ncbi:NUDIX domain-containing protein, partial [Rhodococcus hoagii]|nr:NUDIX domain-containing protein [Prescottella equi]
SAHRPGGDRLVHDGADGCCSRVSRCAAADVSVLAGFVEAGESLETCVVREIREEVGLTCNCPVSRQPPWRSRVRYDRVLGRGRSRRSARIRGRRDRRAHWFTREQIRSALDAGDWTSRSTRACCCRIDLDRGE